MVSPPSRSGTIAAPILAAAKLAGVTRVFRIGGAQAIAALAYGTQSVPKVDKIVGPGNAYVAEAKRQVFGLVSIDMIAGPSEILVIADGASNPAFVAADLALSGIPCPLPPDEVIDAMKAVGDQLPSSLRETGEGGCAACPSACRK
jgi:histidinol dehydrogenase